MNNILFLSCFVYDRLEYTLNRSATNFKNKIWETAIEIRGKKYNTAIYYYNKTLEITEKYNFYYLTRFVYSDLSDINKATGNFKKALEYHEKYLVLKDSLQNVEKYKKIAQIETIYELDKKQAKKQKEKLLFL